MVRLGEQTANRAPVPWQRRKKAQTQRRRSAGGDRGREEARGSRNVRNRRSKPSGKQGTGLRETTWGAIPRSQKDKGFKI